MSLKWNRWKVSTNVFGVIGALLLLASTSMAQTVSYIQGDAGAPATVVQMTLIGSGFDNNDVVTLDGEGLFTTPALVLESGKVLTLLCLITDEVVAGDYAIHLNDATITPSVGNGLFHVKDPIALPTDGGTGDADGAANGTILLDSSLRTDGGVVVLQSFTLPSGKTLSFETQDPNSQTTGNEAYLPISLVVDGDVTLEGTIDVRGTNGANFSQNNGGDGGRGGVGGGGGGGGGPQGTTAVTGIPGRGGDGFTGGGAGQEGSSVSNLQKPGGTGTASGPDARHGGGGPGTATGGRGSTVSSTTPGAGGTGGFFGTGGNAAPDTCNGGTGGKGGGGGCATCNSTPSGGGGGGYATNGAHGGYGASSAGKGGSTYGNSSLIPLQGGSGGAGGDGLITSTTYTQYAGGGGGGGGGVVHLLAIGNLTVNSGRVLADGGKGGDADGGSSACSGGGGGSGGAILLQSYTTGVGSNTLSVHGGNRGINPTSSYQDDGGPGGEGRVRVDGITSAPTLSNGPNGVAGTSYVGPAVSEFQTTTLSGTALAGSDLTIYILDENNTIVGSETVSVDNSGTFSVNLLDALPAGVTTSLYIIQRKDGVEVISPVGALALGPDSDADQIPDDYDNCPVTSNTNQSDRDLDDVGDACDRCPDDPNNQCSPCGSVSSMVFVQSTTARLGLYLSLIFMTFLPFFYSRSKRF